MSVTVIPHSRFLEVRERRRQVVAELMEVSGGAHPADAAPTGPSTIDCAAEERKMFESRGNEVVTRPTMCPFCKSKSVDTLAKVITATTFWRCRQCERTWTIGSLAASPATPR